MLMLEHTVHHSSPMRGHVASAVPHQQACPGCIAKTHCPTARLNLPCHAQHPDCQGIHTAGCMQLDPKAIARERAKAAKTEAKAQKLAKEAATMHKLTGFFRPVRTAS